MNKSTLLIFSFIIAFFPTLQTYAMNTCSDRPRVCTREYRPAQCTFAHPLFGPMTAKGPNPCTARVSLLNRLCSLGIESIESHEIRCRFLPMIEEE